MQSVSRRDIEHKARGVLIGTTDMGSDRYASVSLPRNARAFLCVSCVKELIAQSCHRMLDGANYQRGSAPRVQRHNELPHGGCYGA
jgi:hypothetical protein